MTKYEQMKQAVKDANERMGHAPERLGYVPVKTWDERLEELRAHVSAVQSYEHRAAELFEPLVTRIASFAVTCRLTRGTSTCKDCSDAEKCNTHKMLGAAESLLSSDDGCRTDEECGGKVQDEGKCMKNVKSESHTPPCSATCDKCGSADVSRTHCYSGETFSRGVGDHCERKDDNVDYGMRYGRVNKECIVHHCRVCGFEWSTDVLSNSPMGSVDE
jgi:hypothetical protein